MFMFISRMPFLHAQKFFLSTAQARRLILISTAGLLLLPAGCTATGTTQKIPSTEEDMAGFLSPSQMSPRVPSQRSELIFAQLKLDSALDNNDHDGVLDAANRLLQFGTGKFQLPSSSPFIDAAIWLLAHDYEQDALPLIRKATLQMPDDLPLAALQADLFIQHNERDQAISLLRSFARKHPSNVQAQAELALALLRSAQAGEAMRVFGSIPEKQLTPQIRFAYAQALNISNKFQEARRQLEAAVKADPEYAEAWQLLALTQEELGNKAKALDIYKSLLSADPDNRSARLFLLRLLLQNNDMDGAVAVVTDTQDPLHFSIAAAAMLVEEKRFDQAEKLLSRLEQRFSSPDSLYFYHAALLYEGEIDSEKALVFLEKISSSSAEYDKALRMKVRILYEKKRIDEALATLNELRRLHPRDVEPLLLSSELYIYQNKFKEADEAIAEALRLQPDNENAAFQQAFQQELRGNRDAAMALMEKVIVRFPDNALALNYVGYNLADSNRELDRAYQLIRRAAELEPDADFILDSLAWVHYRRGELDKAWEQIQKALASGDRDRPADPTMMEHYGDIAAARGDNNTARQGWEAALKLFQHFGRQEDAARIRMKLERY